MAKVTFLPGLVTVEAEPGEPVFDVARRAGLFIREDCGGKHKCETCRIEVAWELIASGALWLPMPWKKRLAAIHPSQMLRMGLGSVTILFYGPATVTTAKAERAFVCVLPGKTYGSFCTDADAKARELA